MRIISLAFAAAVFFGLASSANAGEYITGKEVYKVLAEGEVLFAAEHPGSRPYMHSLTVRYDGQIYACRVHYHQPMVVACYTDTF
jgi:hypothetical protein